jgi:spore maturation protein CgeB
LASVPIFDHLFAYRQKNIADLRCLGAQRVTLLRSFYVREYHHPLPGTPKDLDVSFVGHWEDDSRTDYIAAILRQPDIRFGLWGSYWLSSPIADKVRERFGRIRTLGPSEYNLAMNRSRISLVFLSSLNNDTYTRRCFEIPAAGGFMLAPYTEELASLFAEGHEAEYFRSPGEMLDKIRFYLGHEVARARIAAAGRQRLLRDGHEALDRARQMREEIRRLM